MLIHCRGVAEKNKRADGIIISSIILLTATLKSVVLAGRLMTTDVRALSYSE